MWLHGEIMTPPFSAPARIAAGRLLRQLQRGEKPGLPHSRPLPAIGARCHELRIRDRTNAWRIVYRLHSDAIVIVDVLSKTTRTTPHSVIEMARRRLWVYDATARPTRETE